MYIQHNNGVRRNLGDTYTPPWYCSPFPFLPSCIKAHATAAESLIIGPQAAKVETASEDATGAIFQVIADAVHNAATGNLSTDQLNALKGDCHNNLLRACKGDPNSQCYKVAAAQCDREITAAAKPTIPWMTIALIAGGVIGALVLAKTAENFA